MTKTLATAKWLRFNRSLIDPDRSDPWFVDWDGCGTSGMWRSAL
ncbi:hypothetical protein [Synechococcus sp. MVIR-18-1]|nr:hypothetical protein [Synechococcus sp. MVIR-18-1]